jgi:hypothetical protein
MNWKKAFVHSVCILSLSACSTPQVITSEPLPASTVYMAEGINNAKIQFIWLELPDPIPVGTADVRLFLGKTDPPEPTIPNPNELRCLLITDRERAILGPERVPFTFDEQGGLSGSYTYRACPECIECYMNWDYTLEFSGRLSGEKIHMEIAIRHFGLNVPGSYVEAELATLPIAEEEPHISCDHELVCRDIVFEPRE